MKVVVQFSGGKDSTAALLWTLEHITKNPLVVFCDTGFESKVTYEYIDYVEAKLNIPIKRISSDKFDGMLDMVRKKSRFPSTNRRFCTSELKVKPMINFILDLNDDFIAIQGIRKDESNERSKMSNQCTFFKYYFEPYAFTTEGKPKLHTYRKPEIKKFVENKVADILRPVFDWSAKQVVEYILSKGLVLNPLYKKGFKRVGCFPCIMCSQTEIRSLNLFYPDRVKEISEFEIETGASFFPPDKIPKRFCANKSYPTIYEVVNYCSDTDPILFPEIAEKERSCMSFYNICE